MNVAVIGMGYVGTTMSVALGLDGHQVFGIEKDKKKIQSLEQGSLPIYEDGLEEKLRELLLSKQISFSQYISAINSCSVVMIAVGTPASEDGRADLTYVKKVASQIGKHMKSEKLIVIKSTVPVGTGDVVKQIIDQELRRRGVDIPFEIISNPEFLREGRALQDARNPDRIVIGCTSSSAKKTMEALYQSHIDKLYFTTVRNSELIKYASNAFLATKISFANELARLSEKVGANITDVTKGMGMDNRIGTQFLQAGIGYGGSCFPKDTDALLQIGKDAGIDFTLLQAVKNVNDTQVKWFLNKVETTIEGLANKKIAVLGLTFKPHTDDIRESPAIRILDFLLHKKARVSAYDPKGIPAMQRIFPDVTYSADPLEAVDQANAVILATEWPDIVKMDWDMALRKVVNPILFDGRNVVESHLLRGWDYYGVGVCVS
ncbi:UDP-glucose dehydrogenase family protein [Shimazuella kribbensis]|uniref:UDP-glucose dehydrogenase family protein n=1 Tax=Shimazuella kribbensis TaxID=139808 RepID=UPI0003FA5F94|nr:UDP-glucose/GDP-mannose dehydrogenase family protein [Shimazuella kribbensis]